MKYVKTKNIYKGLASMSTVYSICVIFIYFRIHNQNESFNWIGYLLLFCLLLLVYCISLPCIEYYLKQTDKSNRS